jgi:hypothetical protein
VRARPLFVAIVVCLLPSFASAEEPASAASLRSISVIESSWNRLSKEQRDRVEASYKIGVFESGRFARILNVQIVDQSSPGTNAGSAVGSAIGQAQYLDHHNWHNYSATGQLAAGILGALIGAMVDARPQISYRQIYTVRDADGNVRTVERSSDSPVYTAVGLCIDTWNFEPMRDDQCDAYPREVLQALAGTASRPAVESPNAAAAVAPTPQTVAASPPVSTPISQPQTASSAAAPSTSEATTPAIAPPSERGSTLPLRDSRHLFSAERFAKTLGCIGAAATMNIKTASAETFTVTCSAGAAISIRCDPACRELQ